MEFMEKMKHLDPQPEWDFLSYKTNEVLGDEFPEKKEEWPPGRWKTIMVREVLDKIAPPKTFTQDGKKITKKVSGKRAKKEDVKELGKRIQNIIKERNFGSWGIDTSRHEMYSALFDELIRQTAIEFPEVGDILIKIRDHFRREVWNYEQVYRASQVYGYQRIYMEKFDDRLRELEEEREQLIERQKNAMELVESVHEQNRQKMLEYSRIKVDKKEYYRKIKIYQDYINLLLYCFEILLAMKCGIEVDEENVEEGEEELYAEEEESETVMLEELPEDDEPPPPLPGEKEIGIEIKKKKEDVIDKDLVHRENEEEVFDPDSVSKGSTIRVSPETSIVRIQPSENNIQEEEEQSEYIVPDFVEEVGEEISEEGEEEEEQSEYIVPELVEEVGKEISEEEEIEIKFFEKDLLVQEPEKEKTIWDTTEPFKLSKASALVYSIYPEEVKESKPEILQGPEYAILRSLMNPAKYEDLIPTVPLSQAQRKRKTKIIKVKKFKEKLKTHPGARKQKEKYLEDEDVDLSQFNSGHSACVPGVISEKSKTAVENKNADSIKEESSEVSSAPSLGRIENTPSSESAKESRYLYTEDSGDQSDEDEFGEEE